MNKGQGTRVKGQGYKKILIVRMDRIGDVLLSTPAIKAVRDAYPESYIAFMARPYAREVVENNPYLNDIIVYDKKREEKDFLGNLKFIKNLRAHKFDIAVILHPTQRTHLLMFLAGIPVRVGYDKKWGFLLTKRIPHTKQEGLKHEIDYTLDVVRALGIEPKDRALYMSINNESEEKIKKIFADNGIKDTDTVIVMNPGASCPSKRWPADRFAKVADGMIQKYGAKVIFISGASDKAFGDKAASLMKNKCVNLSGRTTVGDIASILKRAKLFISNDSGPVHIACAVGTPVVAIFGRRDPGLSPRRWGPTGKSDIVIHKDVGCRVCLAHNCKLGFKCLAAISPEEVLAAADKIFRLHG